ncbi:response regulator [Streptomyces iconiensis]|uniref:Response regulator transcription factor n=1 Tax=Streptomyces iconiensis TaxID=1384038 RepID=A0ABT7A2C9_9ACTN|nr:response regulator transcription factor [Streptomyces iconiensis]MDJ1135498.1 response regulator transcription factor [Streptomyces iconiensis]
MSNAREFSRQEPIRVFLLDDHEVVRRGLADLLGVEDDIEVVGEAATAAQALTRVPALRPHVAVLDVRLRESDGITVCRELRSELPSLACLMLTSFDEEDALLDSIMAGAAGYVLKQIEGADLVDAIRTVASGKSMLDPSAAGVLMRSLRAEPEEPEQDPKLASLSPRERDILRLIGDGLTNREIGKRLYLSEKTVKNNISRLLGKLGVQRRVQAAVLATNLDDKVEGKGPSGAPPTGHGRT